MCVGGTHRDGGSSEPPLRCRRCGASWHRKTLFWTPSLAASTGHVSVPAMGTSNHGAVSRCPPPTPPGPVPGDARCCAYPPGTRDWSPPRRPPGGIGTRWGGYAPVPISPPPPHLAHRGRIWPRCPLPGAINTHPCPRRTGDELRGTGTAPGWDLQLRGWGGGWSPPGSFRSLGKGPPFLLLLLHPRPGAGLSRGERVGGSPPRCSYANVCK